MLVEFTIKNFRSFKSVQVFSMVADHHVSENNNHTIDTGFKAAPYLHTTSVIYGANASGKSNLIKGMNFLSNFVTNSARGQYGDVIEGITPYLFSDLTKNSPTELEVVFIFDDILYQYGFTLDKERVYEEWLFATHKDKQRQRPQKWIYRDSSDVKNSYINPLLKGEKENWKSSTRDNALILSTALSMNSKSLEAPFIWLREYLRAVNNATGIKKGYSVSLLENSEKKNKLLNFMRDFDLPIHDIITIQKEFSIEAVPEGIIQKRFLEELKRQKYTDLCMLHISENNNAVQLNFEDESDGTQKLFALSGPILDVLEHGYTLVIDELNTSIHPLALSGLVSLFQRRKTNPKNAQLIFTSHDTNIMDAMGKNRLWKVERDKYGASSLISLSRIKGRENEAVEKRYLSGRYGGVPYLSGVLNKDAEE